MKHYKKMKLLSINKKALVYLKDVKNAERIKKIMN